MIRTFGLKTSYSPISLIGEKVYKISWDYLEIKDPIFAELTEEQIAAEESGEHIDRTIVGYEDTDYCSYVYEIMHGDISLDRIKNTIYNWYNNNIDNSILSGFVWNNMPVWLSSENQFNYKAAYDLAIQTNGATLPITFKFGTTLDPIYYTFESIEDFNDFYILAITYINTQLSEGWQKKDSIDWSQYKITE